jgi:hypothetical protein
MRHLKKVAQRIEQRPTDENIDVLNEKSQNHCGCKFGVCVEDDKYLLKIRWSFFNPLGTIYQLMIKNIWNSRAI